jgi:hypothetical protein
LGFGFGLFGVGSFWKGKELLKGKKLLKRKLLKGKEWLKRGDRKSAPRTVGLRKAKLGARGRNNPNNVCTCE